MTTQLQSFEGRPVRSVGIEIPSAAGGLREAMKIEPQEFHHGERVFVVLECDVAKVRFDPLGDDTDDLRRVHVFAAESAVIVDEDLVRTQLDEQAAKIEEAKRRAKGEFTLDEAQLEQAHQAGEHADGLVQGCPPCDHEAALAAEEDGDGPTTPTPIGDRGKAK